MGQDFIEFPNLPNDSAVVTHVPYTDKDKEMKQTRQMVMLWIMVGLDYTFVGKYWKGICIF